jgi:hypothetical protein
MKIITVQIFIITNSIATMFSATTRALITSRSGLLVLPSQQRHLSRPTGVWMSNSSGDASSSSSSSSTTETSVVAICQEKIQKALEAESVKVTGMSIYIESCRMYANVSNSFSLMVTNPYFPKKKNKVHSMIRMDHILVSMSYQKCLKVRDRCNDNNWYTRRYGKNYKVDQSMPWMQ